MRQILEIISLTKPLSRVDLKIVGGEEEIKLVTLMNKARDFRGILDTEDGNLKVFPDPIADYFVYGWLKDRNFDFDELKRECLFLEFLKNMPFRLSANIWGIKSVVVSKIFAGKHEEFEELAVKHWES